MSSNSSDQRTVLKRVGALVKRAQSPTGEDDEEARTAAMQAALMMREHELVLIPKSEIERIETAIKQAQEVARKSKDEAQQKLIMGALAGIMLGKKGIL